MRRRLTAGLLLLVFGATSDVPASSEIVERVLADLRANQQALTDSERDYSRRARSGRLSGAQRSDYAAFLERLRDRVAGTCIELADLGYQFQADDPPCPSLSRHAASQRRFDVIPAQTSVERSAALDAQLDASLSDFDDMLLREQQRIKAAAPRTDGQQGGGRSAASAPGGRQDEAGQTGEWTEPKAASTGSQGDTERRTERRGRYTGSGRRTSAGSPSQKIPGQDEDVVERQLREAAQKETDPELKRKLWDEYHKLRSETAGFDH